MSSLKRWFSQRKAAEKTRIVPVRAAQIERSSVTVDGDESRPVVDVVVDVAETAATVTDQQLDLDALEPTYDLTDQVQAADDNAHAARMQGIENTIVVEEALEQAAQAVEAAANAQTTADGKNARRRGQAEPEPPEGGWTQGDQWVRDNDQGVPVELLVWNGESFVTETTLTGELLVIGEDGTVRLSDGTVTADSIAAGALDFVVARGAQFYGGYIEAPVIVSSDRLGSGANLLNDPTFQSAVNTAWVASGHLGDAATNVTDTFTWDQTVSRDAWMGSPAATLRYRGSAVTSLVLTPATRKTGSLLFANFSWKPANRTYNNPFTYPNPMPFFWYGNAGGQLSEEFKKATAPATATPTSRTTYLTNSAVVSVVAGERWNVRTNFTRVSAEDTALVAIRVELIDASTSAVVWFYDTSAAERTAGAINTWFEPTAPANLKLRIRAVYTAAGGSAVRRMNTGGRVWVTVNGSITTDWTATATNGFHDYASVPGDQTPAGTRGQPPAAIKRRSELKVEMTSAVFAKVEPQQGWRLTEEKGLELFNSLGAQTGRVDGENNFLAGRFATKDAGNRWEVQGDRIVYFNEAELEVGGLRRAGTGVEFFGAIRFQGDSDGWVVIPTPSGWTEQRAVRVRSINGTIHWQGRITPTSPKSGTVTVFPTGTVPEWARPESIYDAMRIVTSTESATDVAARMKSAAVNSTGSVAAWYGGTANSDPINLAGLSGYFVG